MLAESPRVGLVLPLMALAACSGEGQAQANRAEQPAAPKAPSPLEQAEQKVRQELGGDAALTFSAEQTFDSEGATIVCGTVSQAGQPAQRYIAIGEEDLFVESRMEAGHMDRAAHEFCRNAG